MMKLTYPHLVWSSSDLPTYEELEVGTDSSRTMGDEKIYITGVLGPLVSKERKCPQCGSLYDVRTVGLAARNANSFNCLVCDHKLDKWNDTKFPSYSLLKREPWPKL